MPSIASTALSSVGKKIIMAFTGLGLIGFATGHLLGNLLLFNPDPGPFNKYSHTLISLGGFLYIIEAGLLAFFIIHSVSGISVWWGKQKARPDSYKVSGDAGSPSRKTFASENMIYTGSILFIFITMHVAQFKYGPYYETTLDGVTVRDLHRLVIETFTTTGWMIWYAAATSLIGFHLWHGFWSAFQSLGIYPQRCSSVINGIGYLIALILAIGFIGIPFLIYFTRG